jgi:hypothetical protein
MYPIILGVPALPILHNQKEKKRKENDDATEITRLVVIKTQK